MFTMITTESEGKRRLPLFSRSGKLSCQRREGISFAILRVNPRRINWRRLSRRLGNSRVLLGEGLHPPDGAVQPVDVRRYTHILTRNGLRRLLERSRAEAQRREAVLIDLHARHWAYADLLLPYFRTVRVITAQEEAYRRYADACLGACGAAVLVSRTLASPADLYVSPDGVYYPVMESGSAPIIAPLVPSSVIRAPVYSTFRADTPEDLRFSPCDIDPHAYQAALVEHCGVARLTTLVPTRLLLNGTFLPADQVLWR